MFRLASCLAVVVVLVGVGEANATLIPVIDNGGLETNDGHPYNSFDYGVNGWLEYDSPSPPNSCGIANYDVGGYHDRPETWPAITGDGALMMDVRSSTRSVWVFQSLGTVTQDDIDAALEFVGAIQAGTRVSKTNSSSANITMAFRTGTDSLGNLGNAVGTRGTLRVTQPGGANAVPIQLTWTPEAVFVPSAEHLGQEVFYVVSVGGVTFRTQDRGSQYYLDNATLSVIPEPSTLALLFVGGVSILVFALRKCLVGRPAPTMPSRVPGTPYITIDCGRRFF